MVGGAVKVPALRTIEAHSRHAIFSYFVSRKALSSPSFRHVCRSTSSSGVCAPELSRSRMGPEDSNPLRLCVLKPYSPLSYL